MNKTSQIVCFAIFLLGSSLSAMAQSDLRRARSARSADVGIVVENSARRVVESTPRRARPVQRVEDSGRSDRSRRRDDSRHDDFRRGDSRHDDSRHHEHSHQHGHYETICERVFVPGYYKEVHVPAEYGFRFDSCGNRIQFVIRPASCHRVWVEGRWEIRTREVFVPAGRHRSFRR